MLLLQRPAVGCALLLLGIFSALVKASGEEASCSELGFTAMVTCSDCDHMAEYVNDENLVLECRRCCMAEAQDSTTKKYDAAILEVDKVTLGAYPHLQEFVEKRADKFDFLSIRNKWGAPPRLVLKSRKDVDSIRIDNWKTEHVEEYLKDAFPASVE